MLNAVESWASSLDGEYWLIRETVAAVDGRIDGLLVPASEKAPIMKKRRGPWTMRAGVIGVEVKATRADFKRGLEEGQYDRYSASPNLAGLYVVTSRAIKTAEVPDGLGHLVCYEPPGEPKLTGWGRVRSIPTGLRCVARRSPDFRDATMDYDFMWRLIFHAIRQTRAERVAMRERERRAMERIGSAAERQIMSILRRAAAPQPNDGVSKP
jgi:hypothetical protein